MSFTATPVTLALESLADGLHFKGRVGKFEVPMDSAPASAPTVAPNPVQMMMVALGGCTGMDVISILRKKRLEVTAYEVEVGGERRDEHPRIFTRLEIVHRLRGRDLPLAAVEEAVQLSAEKYCTVSGQIRGTAVITHRIEIVKDGALEVP